MSDIRRVLEHKGAHVFSVGPGASVLDAVSIMNEHSIGALVVLDAGEVVGIFTERDLLRRIVGERRDPQTTPVSEAMTRNVVCGHPTMTIEEARAIFMQQRLRHLPVVNEAGQLQGMISIGDLNAWQIDGQEAQISYLHDYLYGRV